MDGEAWWAAVHGVTKSRTGLSNLDGLDGSDLAAAAAMNIRILKIEFIP